MRAGLLAAGLAGALAVSGCNRGAPAATGVSGGDLFARHCASCHPDGGNVLNPAKRLGRRELAANGITDVPGIVEKIRKPGPRMTVFDRQRLTDEEARRIGSFILETFP